MCLLLYHLWGKLSDMVSKRSEHSMLERIFVGILLIVFAGIVLHAPLTVGLSTLFPNYENIIKSWKEVLLGIALVLAIIEVSRKKQWQLLHVPLLYYMALFAALNILLVFAFTNTFEATIAGLFINLRFFLFFGLVYIALKLYPQYYQTFLRVFIGGALVVLGFAILQVTVLPYDVLRLLGYGESTIMPYLTVDQNELYVRINSTLRGPNPLGLYVAIVIPFVLLLWRRPPRQLSHTEQILLAVLGVGSVVALWASYSRSAALAGAIAVAIIVIALYGKRISRTVWLIVAIVALVASGGVIALRDTPFVSQVIFHEDPREGNNVNSNDGHAQSLANGTQRLLSQPLGAGVGSTGSASLHTDSPIIIENQYLFIAHETGWLGLGLFLLITYTVLKELWQRRLQWLALAVFASGVGVAVAGLVLPVWVDDTVSIIWWGLAAMALSLPMAAKRTHEVRKKLPRGAKKSTKKEAKHV